MAIAYKSQGAGAGTETSSASLDLVCPATVDANDILVAHVTYLDITTTPSTPSGWELLYGPANLGTGTAVGRSWVFGKLAIGDEDGDTIGFGTDGGTTGRYGRIYSFDGWSSGTILQVIRGFSNTPTEGTIPLPTVTTTETGALAVALLTQDDNNSFAAAGAVTGGTWAEAVAEFVSTTIGAQGCICGIQTSTPTGNPGTITGGTANATADEGSTIGFEIRSTPSANPNFAGIGTQLQGTASTAAIDLPDGVTVKDILRATLFVDTTATVTALPTGWANAADSPESAANHRLYVMWKRIESGDAELTGSTADFTLSASVYRQGAIERYTDAIQSGDPWDVTRSEFSDTSLNDSQDVADTTTVTNTLLCWSGTNWSGGTWTPPSGFTERRDSGDGTSTSADKVLAAAGSTGTIVGTCTGSDKSCAWMGALKPPSTGTSPAAGSATAAGSAPQPAIAVAPNAGNPTGAGTAPQPAARVEVEPPAATGAGTAPQPAASLGVLAGLPTAAGDAPQPTIDTSGAATNAPAGLASAAGDAPQPTASIGALASAATAAGSAPQPAVAIQVNAGAATAAGEAPQPTVSTSAATNAPAGSADATGSAPQPAIAITATAGTATAAGTAPQPAVSVSPTVGSPVAAGTAPQPSAGLGAAAGSATASGTAPAPTAHVGVLAPAPAAAGSADGATVSTATFTNAPAGTASAAGSAPAPTVSVAVLAGIPTAAGSAPQPTILSVGQAPPEVGSWYTLLAIMKEAEVMRVMDAAPQACPNDGEPLQKGPHGEVFCPFDGWTPEETPAAASVGLSRSDFGVVDRVASPDDPPGWG